MKPRIELLHGVNLDMLGVRPAEHYGALTLPELEAVVIEAAAELGFELVAFQTNHEGELVERLHRAREASDGLILNPGAWTHYSWALRDALEIAGLPTVEVHLSDVDSREQWRRNSVIRDLCLATVKGKGPDGYREALELLSAELGERSQ